MTPSRIIHPILLIMAGVLAACGGGGGGGGGSTGGSGSPPRQTLTLSISPNSITIGRSERLTDVDPADNILPRVDRVPNSGIIEITIDMHPAVTIGTSITVTMESVEREGEHKYVCGDIVPGDTELGCEPSREVFFIVNAGESSRLSRDFQFGAIPSDSCLADTDGNDLDDPTEITVTATEGRNSDSETVTVIVMGPARAGCPPADGMQQQQRQLAGETQTLALSAAASQAEMVAEVVRSRIGAPIHENGIRLTSLPPEGVDAGDLTGYLTAQASQSVASGARYAVWAAGQEGVLDGAHVGLEWISPDGRDAHGLAISTGVSEWSFAGATDEFSRRTGGWHEDITIFAPYLTRKTGDAELWAVAGVGTGEVALEGGRNRAATDSQLSFLQGGMAYDGTLAFGLQATLDVRGMASRKDVSAYRLGAVDVPDVSARLARVDGAGSLSWPLPLAGGRVTPQLGVDVLHDFADVLPRRARHRSDMTAGLSWVRGVFSASLQGLRTLNDDEFVSRSLSGGVSLRQGDDIDLSLEMQTRHRLTIPGDSLSEDSARIKVRWAF